MEQNRIILFLFLFALFVYFLTYIKKRPKALLSFIGRGASGLIFIHFFNLLCASKDIITHVSINPTTTAISCFLGLPGVLLAYAVRLWGLR